jgi:hypothetical protein
VSSGAVPQDLVAPVAFGEGTGWYASATSYYVLCASRQEDHVSSLVAVRTPLAGELKLEPALVQDVDRPPAWSREMAKGAAGAQQKIWSQGRRMLRSSPERRSGRSSGSWSATDGPSDHGRSAKDPGVPVMEPASVQELRPKVGRESPSRAQFELGSAPSAPFA